MRKSHRRHVGDSTVAATSACSARTFRVRLCISSLAIARHPGFVSDMTSHAQPVDDATSERFNASHLPFRLQNAGTISSAEVCGTNSSARDARAAARSRHRTGSAPCNASVAKVNGTRASASKHAAPPRNRVACVSEEANDSAAGRAAKRATPCHDDGAPALMRRNRRIASRTGRAPGRGMDAAGYRGQACAATRANSLSADPISADVASPVLQAGMRTRAAAATDRIGFVGAAAAAARAQLGAARARSRAAAGAGQDSVPDASCDARSACVMGICSRANKNADMVMPAADGTNLRAIMAKAAGAVAKRKRVGLVATKQSLATPVKACSPQKQGRGALITRAAASAAIAAAAASGGARHQRKSKAHSRFGDKSQEKVATTKAALAEQGQQAASDGVNAGRLRQSARQAQQICAAVTRKAPESPQRAAPIVESNKIAEAEATHAFVSSDDVRNVLDAPNCKAGSGVQQHMSAWTARRSSRNAKRGRDATFAQQGGEASRRPAGTTFCMDGRSLVTGAVHQPSAAAAGNDTMAVAPDQARAIFESSAIELANARAVSAEHPPRSTSALQARKHEGVMHAHLQHGKRATFPTSVASDPGKSPSRSSTAANSAGGASCNGKLTVSVLHCAYDYPRVFRFAAAAPVTMAAPTAQKAGLPQSAAPVCRFHAGAAHGDVPISIHLSAVSRFWFGFTTGNRSRAPHGKHRLRFSSHLSSASVICQTTLDFSTCAGHLQAARQRPGRSASQGHAQQTWAGQLATRLNTSRTPDAADMKWPSKLNDFAGIK